MVLSADSGKMLNEFNMNETQQNSLTAAYQSGVLSRGSKYLLAKKQYSVNFTAARTAFKGLSRR
jgi:hypothetical protein